MTRFARAKGSKASNLKSPEDSTPWEVMKEQLLKAKNETEESKKREEAEQQRIENYNNFLKEHKVQKRKATWCDFPESENSTDSKVTSKQKYIDKNIEKKGKKIKPSHTKINESISISPDSNESEVPKKKKKKRNKDDNTVQEDHKQDSVLPLKEQSISNNEKKKKSKKKQKSLIEINVSNEMSNGNEKHTPNIPIEESESKKNRNNKQNKKLLSESKSDNATIDESVDTKVNKPNLETQAVKKSKNKQLKNGTPKRRKPINDKSFQLIINGKEVQLVRFDGFPIIKKDADRLEELKKNMIKKGIPKSEIQRTMKLERRRAEKALARLKRDVCYNCRKGGHNLSDCPDLKSNIPNVDSAEGVCFKCGSTEHRQFECKVQNDKEFRFATCFICKESGHIARQCPDNPKGLYPNGGCCKLCGDVTHLRKDCPTVKDKKEEKSIKLQTLNDDNIEDLGYRPNQQQVSQETSKKPKKIKF
ncbi:unnamed protein product [Euphydryas editha]|uniref:CCHC-type domain-containing protein n=1 Tax=Euphydryas editha TaxID=104508 RepID=A0AAU9U213_EUPED|nr:unnamed protein product [Euphydryas editha]